MPIYEFKCNVCEEIVEELFPSVRESFIFDGSPCVCGGQLIRMYSGTFIGKSPHQRSLILSDGTRVKGKFEK